MTTTEPSTSTPPPLPRYGEASLADLVPSLLTALDVPGFANPLGVEPLRRVCLFFVDGLGWDLLAANASHAPFLAAAAASGRPLTAGFPASTATSLGSIGTGLTPGEHGLVGYTLLLPGHTRAMNMILWEMYGVGPHHDLRADYPPETFQPATTAFEKAAADGVGVTLVGPAAHAHSPLTRAVLRGGKYRSAHSLGDLVAESAQALTSAGRTFVYAYHADLDATGHVRGPDSDAWRLQLAHIDRVASTLAERLPRDAALVVSGDHGMVNLTAAQRIDIDDHPELKAGVRALAGEARARFVHTAPGAQRDVLAAWRSILGERMWVVTGDEAVAAGWFGPTVPDRVRDRIGDVVAAAFGPVGVVQRSVDSMQSRFTGHHGSMTQAEQLVPFILVQR